MENYNEEKNEREEKKTVAVIKKKKGRKHKERLLILLLLLLFTGTMLGTSTYAWFTSNENVSIQDITVNVSAQNGIQISANGSAWKSILQTADINGAATNGYTDAVNQMPTSMDPVSTIGELDEDGFMKMFKGTIKSSTFTGSCSSGDYDELGCGTMGGVWTPETLGEYILTAEATPEEVNGDGVTASFVAFDIFLKVDKDTDVWMTEGSGVTSVATDKGIKNAARIGFVNYGNVAAGSDVATIQGIARSTSASVYIWEPNYDVHTDAAVANASDVYGKTTTKTGATVLTYRGVKAEIEEADNNLLGDDTNDDFFGDMDAIEWTTPEAGEDVAFFQLKAGITKVRVYMWIEGQDVDCENQASGTTIKYNLQLTTVDPNA